MKLSKGFTDKEIIAKKDEEIKELKALITKTCDNALELGYCSKNDCKNCNKYKIWEER